MKKINKNPRTLSVVFDRSTTLCEVDQFVDKFRQKTDSKDEIVIDLGVSKKGGYKISLTKHKKKEIYH